MEQFQHFAIRLLSFVAYLIGEIWSIEASDMHIGIIESELSENILLHPFGRRGSERHHRNIGITFAQRAQLAIFGTKVVSPLAHTVRLVDCQQRDAVPPLHRIQQSEKIARQQAFGSHIDQLAAALQDSSLALDPLIIAQTTIHKSCCNTVRLQSIDLILHKGNQR